MNFCERKLNNSWVFITFQTVSVLLSCKFLANFCQNRGIVTECIKRCLLKFAINTNETYVNLINATLIHRKTRLLNYTANSCSEFY